MTTLREEFEALMPEPAGYSPFPGEFYPSEQLDAEVKADPFVTRLYTADQVRKAMKAVAERCAVICEALRDDHCKGTRTAPTKADWCQPDDLACEFVVAWNDAAAAIRAQAGGDQT